MFSKRSEVWLEALWKRCREKSEEPFAGEFFNHHYNYPGKTPWAYNPKEACDKFDSIVATRMKEAKPAEQASPEAGMSEVEKVEEILPNETTADALGAAETLPADLGEPSPAEPATEPSAVVAKPEESGAQATAPTQTEEAHTEPPPVTEPLPPKPEQEEPTEPCDAAETLVDTAQTAPVDTLAEELIDMQGKGSPPPPPARPLVPGKTIDGAGDDVKSWTPNAILPGVAANALGEPISLKKRLEECRAHPLFPAYIKDLETEDDGEGIARHWGRFPEEAEEGYPLELDPVADIECFHEWLERKAVEDPTQAVKHSHPQLAADAKVALDIAATAAMKSHEVLPEALELPPEEVPSPAKKRVRKMPFVRSTISMDPMHGLSKEDVELHRRYQAEGMSVDGDGDDAQCQVPESLEHFAVVTAEEADMDGGDGDSCEDDGVLAALPLVEDWSGFCSERALKKFREAALKRYPPSDHALMYKSAGRAARFNLNT